MLSPFFVFIGFLRLTMSKPVSWNRTMTDHQNRQLTTSRFLFLLMGRNQVKEPICLLKASTEAFACFCGKFKRLFIILFFSSKREDFLIFLPGFCSFLLIHLITSLMDMFNYSRFLVLAYRWKPGQRRLY